MTLERLGVDRVCELRLCLFWVRCRPAQTGRTNERHELPMNILSSNGAQTFSQTKQRVTEVSVGNLKGLGVREKKAPRNV
jgi:hypothetical protein